MKQKLLKLLKKTVFLILGFLIGTLSTYFLCKEGLWAMYGEAKARHFRDNSSYLESIKDEPPSKTRDEIINNTCHFILRIETVKNQPFMGIAVSDKNMEMMLRSVKKDFIEKGIDLNSIKLKDEKGKQIIGYAIKVLNKY